MLALLAVLAALDAGASVAPAPPSAALRDGKQILADYARAIGDENAWRKHRSVRVKRAVSVKTMNFESDEETRLLRSGKLYSVSSAPSLGVSRNGYDGKIAWGQDPFFGLRVLRGAEAEDVRIAATWNLEWRLGEVYPRVKAVPPPEGAPAPASLECVELGKAEGKPTVVCFDRATHLRAWEKGVRASPAGEVPYVTRYSDWRTVDGVRVWFREDVTVGPVTMECRIVAVVFDEPVPVRLFALPKKK